MARSGLNPKIFEYLKKRLKGQVKEKSIRPALSRIRNTIPGLTLNAAAEVYARKQGFTISRYLTDEDRETLRPIQFIKVKIPSVKPEPKKKLKIMANYDTNNRLLIAHLKEINKVYTYGCYTACFILCRKLLENLLVHHIIRKKYSSNTEGHRKIYFDFDRGRYLNLSTLIKNLRDNSGDFGPENKLIERICQLSEGFKETANDMTHSLYYIARKKELDMKNMQNILGLIKSL